MSLADPSAYIKAAIPGRYLLFRFAPIVLVGFLGGRIIEDQGWPAWPFVVTALTLHAGTTSLRAVLRESLYGQYGVRHVPLIILHLCTVVVVAACLVLPALFGGVASELAPDFEQMRDGIWAGLVGSAIAFVFIRLLSKPARSTSEMVETQQHRVGEELRGYARRRAHRAGLDPDLVEAVILVESLQRPRWFRHLERLKGIIIRPGSYGIMQVQADRPLSDRQSIDLALHEFRDVFQTAEDGAITAWERISSVRLSRYNSSPDFVELVREFYDYLHERPG